MKLAYPTHFTGGRDTQKRIKQSKRSAYEFDKDNQKEIALSLNTTLMISFQLRSDILRAS
jgi:hypothetical protein